MFKSFIIKEIISASFIIPPMKSKMSKVKILLYYQNKDEKWYKKTFGIKFNGTTKVYEALIFFVIMLTQFKFDIAFVFKLVSNVY